MKKTLLLLGMLSLSSLAFAQISKQQAINLVLDSIVNRDTTNVNVYMEPILQTDSYYKMSRYDSISSPYANYWLFFIDDMPEYGWGHNCRYVLVNQNDGSMSVRESQTPPWHFKLKLEVVSESILFPAPIINFFGTYDTCLLPTPVEGKYAVLFSGGEEDGNTLPTAFWNALSHSYCGLIENGFKEENIFVLFCDGNLDSLSNGLINRDLNKDGRDDIIDTICSVANLQWVFDSLANIMKDGDLLYVYGTMHGYQDELDTTRYWLSIWEQEHLYDTTFANMLSRINCSQYFINLFACYGGAIIHDFLSCPNNLKKTVLTCIGNRKYIRNATFCLYSGMDIYNYFINTAFRYYHPQYNAPWSRSSVIGALIDDSLFSFTANNEDINFDMLINNGNSNSLYEINEAIEYCRLYDTQFNHWGTKHYDCGFKDDLLSLHGITGKVVSTDTVSGSFHIEDTLAICVDSLMMENFTKLYLFDANLIIEDTASLIMGDNCSIIARSGDCRIIVKGLLTLGSCVTFEARNGSTLEIIFENDADLAISNATFFNCTLDLPKQNLSFDRCNFMGTPLVMDNTLNQNLFDGKTATISSCKFVPNGKEIDNALFIKNFAYYNVSGCTIETEDNGIFKNGIVIYNSGSNSGLKHVSGNDISGCMAAGVQMYASAGDITMNTITRNGFGIKLLNNCNIGFFSGDCGATTENKTQFIHNNDDNEIYMTGSSIPQWFRYNAIADIDNIPFVYHDAYANVGFPNDSTLRKAIDVTYNHWGNNFIPSTHLYTTLIDGCYDYNPSWVIGSCDNEKDGGMVLLSEADSLNNIGQYSIAKSLYRQVVTSFPATVSAETALKSLFLLEEASGENYEVLQDYYLSDESIATNFTLSHLASSLANKCDEKLENYEEAIAWYENVLTDPETSFNDSIFAAIDLGDLYLKIEANGGKGRCGKLKQYVPESMQTHKNQTDFALSLLPNENVNYVEIMNMDDNLPPVSNLSGQVFDNDTILLSWDLPDGCNTSPLTLSWLIADTINDLVQYGYDSYMSNLYDTLDLIHFIGWKIESVSFYKNSNWTHVIYIWEKKRDEPMHVLYSQEVPDEIPFGLNTIPLDENLHIEQGTNYWIGLRITRDQGQQGYTYPFGMIWRDGVNGKSNLIMDTPNNSPWEILPFDMHFWIRTNLVDTMYIDYKDIHSLTGYRIYRDGTLIKEIPYSFVTYYTDTEFTKGFDVEYCVTAVYGDGESEPICTTIGITGVAEETKDGCFTLSPNPTNGLVRIEGGKAAEVSVCNTLGQLVKTVQNTNEISLNGLPQGVYLLRITDENGATATRKIMVR